MVCEMLAQLIQMRNGNLADALRLLVSACRCKLAEAPRYWAPAGEESIVDPQRCRGIVVL